MDILFSEMTPKKIIEKFSTYGGMAFLGKMSDTQKGELLRAFLIPKTDCIKVTFVHYFSGWRIDEDKKSMTYYMMSKELRNNIKKGYPLENYHFPSFLAKTWQKSIVPLIMFKNVFSSLLPTAVLITWVHYGLLYSVLESKGFLISMPLYIIGQEYGIMKLVQSIMRGLHCKEDNCIALLEEKRKFEQDLFCARDEVIIINNTISATTKTQQQKQEERLLLLNRFISGDQKISGPNKAISKKIEAAIVILGRTLPEEKNILSLEIESTMLNQKALQKWFLNADSITDYFCHFIDMYKCGWEVYDKALNTALEANICEGQSLFEEMDYVQAYAVLASMADLLSIYVRREQLEISPSDFIGKMKDEIVNFLQYNKEMDLAGLSMLLKSILKKNLPVSSCYKLSNKKIPIDEDIILFDENFVYISSSTLKKWLKSDEVNVPLIRILQAVQKDGYLKTYDTSTKTYVYKICISAENGKTQRISRIALNRHLFEEEGELPILWEGENRNVF